MISHLYSPNLIGLHFRWIISFFYLVYTVLRLRQKKGVADVTPFLLKLNVAIF